MSSWSPSDPLPHQLADAFAVMYDWFDHSYMTSRDNGESYFTLADNDDWKEIAAQDDHVRKLASEVMNSTSGTTPHLLQEAIDRAREDSDTLEIARQVYCCLHAIDQGLKYQTPYFYFSPSRSSGLDRAVLLERLDSVYRYNDKTPGYVLPKWATRHRGTELAEHFMHLVRADVDRAEVRIIGRNARARNVGTMRNPQVVVVPMLYRMFADTFGPADATFSGLTIGSEEYFEVVHTKENVGILEDRVRRAVADIRASKANIAIFPELSLTQPLAELLSSELDRTRTELELADDAVDDPLQWVIAGVATPSGRRKPWLNEAHVLNSSGNLVSCDSEDGGTFRWQQQKRHRYKLTADEQEKYGTSILFDTLCDRQEAIHVSRSCYVFEDRSGRYAIVICEDLSQEQHTMDLLRKMLCKAIYVIVMDGPMISTRWASIEGGKFATQTGSIVVVANSLLIPNIEKNRQYRTAKEQDKEILSAYKEERTVVEITDPYPHGKQPVGLIIDPPWEDRKTVQMNFLSASTTPPPTADALTISDAGEVELLRPAPTTTNIPFSWRLHP